MVLSTKIRSISPYNRLLLSSQIAEHKNFKTYNYQVINKVAADNKTIRSCIAKVNLIPTQ